MRRPLACQTGCRLNFGRAFWGTGMDREEEKSLMARLIGRYPQSPEARYLRKLNAGADSSRWKSGSGLPRVALPAPKDSLASPADDKAGGSKSPDSSNKATGSTGLPPAGTIVCHRTRFAGRPPFCNASVRGMMRS